MEGEMFFDLICKYRWSLPADEEEGTEAVVNFRIVGVDYDTRMLVGDDGTIFEFPADQLLSAIITGEVK